MITTRERCQMCHRYNPVGFHVPSWLWELAVHPHWQNSIVCLDCFIRGADEKMLRWERQIKLYPMSLAAHIEFAADVELPPDAGGREDHHEPSQSD